MGRKFRCGLGQLLIVLSFLAGSLGWAQTAQSPVEIVDAVVGLQSKVPADARTASILGLERVGSGVVIKEDIVLTVGYLIMEANAITVIDKDDNSTPATYVAYHNETGFGLIKANAPLGLKPIALGDSAALSVGDSVLVISRIGDQPMTPARVVSRRTFVGSWEYKLENAIFTAPAHRGFGGAALVNRDGQLVGIGSLLVQDAMTKNVPSTPGNMFVPVEWINNVLDELMSTGRSGAPRPWLGVYTEMFRGHLFVTRIANDSPAQLVDIEAGDIVLNVDDQRVRDESHFLELIWAQGAPGVEIKLTLLRAAAEHTVTIESMDRYEWLKLDPESLPAKQNVAGRTHRLAELPMSDEVFATRMR